MKKWRGEANCDSARSASADQRCQERQQSRKKKPQKHIPQNRYVRGESPPGGQLLAVVAVPASCISCRDANRT